ncbi:hypothetical protein MJO29_000080 [Puccinia striiformis f. sp. tritici]|nr:hypothetical protein MJO29_000080 [Puccinia striiformis f. sp. tritici]
MPVELSLRPWIFLWTITLFAVTISATSPDELPTWWHEGPLWDRTPSPIAGDPDSLLDYHDLSWTASHFDRHSELPPHADSLPHWHPQARPFQVTPASWETTSTSFDDVPSMANQQVGALKRKHGDYEQLFNVEPFAPASSPTHLSRSQDPFLNGEENLSFIFIPSINKILTTSSQICMARAPCSQVKQRTITLRRKL